MGRIRSILELTGRSLDFITDGNTYSRLAKVFVDAFGDYVHLHNTNKRVGIGEEAGSPAKSLHVRDSGGIGVGVESTDGAAHFLAKGVSATGIVDVGFISFEDEDGDYFFVGMTGPGAGVAKEFRIANSTIGECLRILQNGKIGIGTTTVPHDGEGLANMAIDGADGGGVSIQMTTDADKYPIFHILPFQHDNVGLFFDAYLRSDGGAWLSGDAGSNFNIYKIGDKFKIQYDSGVAQGGTITWNDGIVMLTDGKVGIGVNPPTQALDVAGHIKSSGSVIAKQGDFEYDLDGGKVGVQIQNLDQKLHLRAYFEASTAQYATIYSTNDALAGGPLILNEKGGAVGIGAATTPNPNSSLDITGVGLPMILPRMTNAQKPGAPANGMIAYITDGAGGGGGGAGNVQAYVNGAWAGL
jgi:hypothetical protein